MCSIWGARMPPHMIPQALLLCTWQRPCVWPKRCAIKSANLGNIVGVFYSLILVYLHSLHWACRRWIIFNMKNIFRYGNSTGIMSSELTISPATEAYLDHLVNHYKWPWLLCSIFILLISTSIYSDTYVTALEGISQVPDEPCRSAPWSGLYVYI